jgi:protease-4
MEKPFVDPIENTGVKKKKDLKAPLIVFIILFVCSAFLNLIFFFVIIGLSLTIVPEPQGFREVVVDGEPFETDKILLLRVDGAIVREGGFSGRVDPMVYVKKRLKAVEDNKEDYKAILLVVNSPGGGITECDGIHKLLADYKAKLNIPIVAHFQNISASGGYYISAGCDEIIAQPTTLTGSIGVIMMFLQAGEMMNKIGVKANVIKSSKTPYKDIGSPFRPMEDQERAMLQKMADEMYDRFVDVVAKGRKNLSKEEVEQVATGMIFSGQAALEKKLVDSLGYFEDAARAVRARAGAPQAKIVELRSRPSLMESLLQAQQKDIELKVMSFEKFANAYKGLPMYLWFPGCHEK